MRFCTTKHIWRNIFFSIQQKFFHCLNIFIVNSSVFENYFLYNYCKWEVEIDKYLVDYS